MKRSPRLLLTIRDSLVCRGTLVGGVPPGNHSPKVALEERKMMRPLYLKILSCMMVMILPAALFAAEQPAAMLYSHGTALLNGNSIARSAAIFSGDLVQTQADSVANINAVGSSILVLNDSLVQYEDGNLKLEHGGL